MFNYRRNSTIINIDYVVTNCALSDYFSAFSELPLNIPLKRTLIIFK